METETHFRGIIPVLPSADIKRDVEWYKEKMGFKIYHADHLYGILYRETLIIHLQWHADTTDDPLLGGSVIRIYVKTIKPLFEEFVQRGAVSRDNYIANTLWKTNEFGFFDLNHNSIFVMEDIE
jgi:hypothetical protein